VTEGDFRSLRVHGFRYLSYDNVSSGRAVQNAEKVLDSLRRRQVIEETLPQAWEQILSEPDELLVDLIQDRVESISGFRAEVHVIESFLARNMGARFESKHTVKKPDRVPAGKESKIRKPGPTYTGAAIAGFRFLGNEPGARIWKDLLTTLATIMLESHESEFDKVLDLRGTKRRYFSRHPGELRDPVRIGGSSIFAETHFSARTIVCQSTKLIEKFGYDADDLEIHVT
jgi:hypothetical protein